MFERLEALITKEDLNKISKSKILLVGIGGVGGYTLEALVRSGFNNITIIDGDTIAKSNLNRQIITLNSNLNEYKTTVAIKRMQDINPNINIKEYHAFLTLDNISDYLNPTYDYIIDACDDLKIKTELIKYAKTNNIKIITCLGTARKIHPGKLVITKLNKTFNDPLAKVLRNNLRKEKISLDIPVVFSSEEPIKTKDNVLGSAIFVPASAGIMLANYVFLNLIENNLSN